MEMDVKKPLEIRMVVNIVLIALIGVVCLIGNILVIRALIFSKYPKIPIYIAIGGMALADMLNMIMEIPYNVFSQLEMNNLMNTPLCKAHFYLTSVCAYVAGLHLVLFSIIRCIMLNDRVRSRSYVRHTLVACIVIWIVICLTNVLNLKTVTFEENLGCIELGSDLTAEDERIMWLRFGFSYLIPLVIITVLYVVTKVLSMRFYDESYSSRERRFSKMVTFLVVTFAIFKLPDKVLEVIIFYKTRYVYKLVHEGADIYTNQDIIQLTQLFDISKYTISVSLIDLAIRPIIYAKFSYYFGQSFDEILNCNSCREKKRPPRRKKTDSGMSNHTNLIEDDGQELEADQNFDSENDVIDRSSVRDEDKSMGEGEKFLGTETTETVDVESQPSDYKVPISIYINNTNTDKEISLFVGSICNEKNGDTRLGSQRKLKSQEEIKLTDLITPSNHGNKQAPEDMETGFESKDHTEVNNNIGKPG